MADNTKVYITHEAFQAIKTQSAMEGRTMKFLISRLIMDYVTANKEGTSTHGG